MRVCAALLLILLLAACRMPVTSTRSVDSRPSISLSNVNDRADLYVDGLRMGKAADYEEPNELNLEPGTHRVSIVEGGRTTFEQTIFIESEHKTIIAK